MPKPHPDIWRVEVVVPLFAVESFETAMEQFTDAVSWFLADPDADENNQQERWRLEGFSRTPVERAKVEAAIALTATMVGIDIPPFQVEMVPDIDWVLATLQSFPPIDAGRFFVHGSHYEGKVPAGRIGLLIDAGTAFGSGEHATTYSCLRAIDLLLKRRSFRRPLDLGCGSGILGIALAKATHNKVTASDIDPISVTVANINARRNGVGSGRRFRAFQSDGYRGRALRKGKPYDLIVANILARPLAHMAADLSRHLTDDGIAVLSGLLNSQERYVMATHRAQGLSMLGKIRMNGWTALVIGRGPRARI